MEADRPRVPHCDAFSSHFISMTAGVAPMNELRPPVYEHLNRIGKMVRSAICSLSNSAGVRLQVAGIGSLFHIFLTDQEILDHRSAETANACLLSILDLGLLNRAVYFAPGHSCSVSPVTTEDGAQTTLRAVTKTLESVKTIILYCLLGFLYGLSKDCYAPVCQFFG